MRDLDQYRCLSTEGLLEAAREHGIDPDMAVVLAERLERVYDDERFDFFDGHDSMGGRYTFNHRSRA